MCCCVLLCCTDLGKHGVKVHICIEVFKAGDGKVVVVLCCKVLLCEGAWWYVC